MLLNYVVFAQICNADYTLCYEIFIDFALHLLFYVETLDKLNFAVSFFFLGTFLGVVGGRITFLAVEHLPSIVPSFFKQAFPVLNIELLKSSDPSLLKRISGFVFT
ncbi:Hypothetical_protein [Hexamita inflata]|uniref:Hypothetical_protein n=1 Tax=Hexamita inflata TaxID=28002 RepID=A0AA86USA2_9EUKA|nr:Hypothetical protein HINF_LOCUS57375 [Hexamita inflata]